MSTPGYKRYLQNASVPIPKRTRSRRKRVLDLNELDGLLMRSSSSTCTHQLNLSNTNGDLNPYTADTASQEDDEVNPDIPSFTCTHQLNLSNTNGDLNPYTADTASQEDDEVNPDIPSFTCTRQLNLSNTNNDLNPTALASQEDDEVDHGNQQHPDIPPSENEPKHPAIDSTPIYDGSDVSRSQVLAMTLAYVIRHHISGIGLRDLLDLLNLIVPGCVPKSKYYFDKFFNGSEDEIEYHYYCPDCQSMLDVNCSCSNCNLTFEKSCLQNDGNYFLTIPLSHQLKNLFENHDLDKYITKPCNTGSCMSDLTDGNFCRSNPELLSFLSEQDNISLSFFTDGVPVFKSSKFSIWPLFCTVNEVSYDKRSEFIILHSLWFGPNKPVIETYCKPFLKEMNVLRHSGVIWQDRHGVSHTTKCTALLCVCDSVARPMLQNFKQFNGHYGCNCCLHPGERVENRQVYVTTADAIEERSHGQTIRFAEEAHEAGQSRFGVKGPSPFLLLEDFDIIKSFPVDYMHCVLLGVVRQFTELMLDSSFHERMFYLGRRVQQIDELLLSVRPPSEIKRSPRSISLRRYWKASEWRTYLLYYSPVVLSNCAPAPIYRHWMLLVHAIHLLLGQSIAQADIEIARSCLTKFVVLIPSLYGEQHCSYNAHLLTHLCDTVENWGPLWSCSAFLFESANGKLMNMFHGTQAVPVQIVTRFLAHRHLTELAKSHLENAPDSVTELYNRLSQTSHIVKQKLKIESCTLLGCGKTGCLTVTQTVEMQRLIGQTIQTRECTMFDRFLMDGKLLSTASYCTQFKRDNSVVQLKDGVFGIIQKCFTSKPLCVCVGVCTCNIEVFVCLSELVATRRHRVFDDFVNVNLADIMTNARKGQNIFIRRASEITHKCLTISINEQDFILKLLKVDSD